LTSASRRRGRPGVREREGSSVLTAKPKPPEPCPLPCGIRKQLRRGGMVGHPGRTCLCTDRGTRFGDRRPAGSATPQCCPEYCLPTHRLHLRQHLFDVFLSCIPSEFLSHVRPSGSPSTGAGRPAHVTPTQLFWPDHDAMGNAINCSAPSIGIFTVERLGFPLSIVTGKFT
jgi:hypothetical protein